MRLFNVLVCVGVVGFFASDYVRDRVNDRPAAIPAATVGKPADAPRRIKENVVAYSTGDGAMNAAKQKARATLPRFRDLVARRVPGTYTVKFPLTQNGATEHIWLQVASDRGPDFVGRLANDPVNGTTYKRGDRMTVAARDVEDWMITGPSEIYGGYTARAALDQMPKDQQAKLRGMFRD